MSQYYNPNGTKMENKKQVLERRKEIELSGLSPMEKCLAYKKIQS